MMINIDAAFMQQTAVAAANSVSSGVPLADEQLEAPRYLSEGGRVRSPERGSFVYLAFDE